MFGIGAAGVGLAACGMGSSSTSSSSSASAATTATGEIPDETAGPYPGGGSNGSDVLEQSGIVRRDIRSSFGEYSGTAEGVPMTVELVVADLANGGVPFAGAAVYVWHCDRDGGHSLYSQGIEDQNYLRGVQIADADGRVTFTSVFPAGYSGRWHHGRLRVVDRHAVAGRPRRRQRLRGGRRREPARHGDRRRRQRRHGHPGRRGQQDHHAAGRGWRPGWSRWPAPERSDVMSLGPVEIGLIVLAVMLLFGCKQLPEASRSLGSSLRIFRGEVAGSGETLRTTSTAVDGRLDHR